MGQIKHLTVHFNPSVRHRILVTAFRSPGPIAPLSASAPGSMFPACNFRSANPRLYGPFGLSAPLPRPVCPDLGRFFASRPLPLPRSLLPTFPKTFTPLRGFYPPLDQRSVSVQPVSPPPDPPDLPSLPTARFVVKHRRLRIIVPGPLRFRRLAVPPLSATVH